MCSEGYGSWVCLSVTQHLTSRTSVRLTDDTVDFTGNEGQIFRAVFSESAPVAKLERFHIVRVILGSGHYLAETRMHIIFDHVVESGHFVSPGEKTSKLRELLCLRARYAHSVKLLYH